MAIPFVYVRAQGSYREIGRQVGEAARPAERDVLAHGQASAPPAPAVATGPGVAPIIVVHGVGEFAPGDVIGVDAASFPLEAARVDAAAADVGNVTFQVADAIGLLAALGFLGFGVPAPGTSWGQMLSNGISYAQEGAWWLIYPAGICIILITVSFNYIGDALRDAVEVRLQRR